MNMDKNLMFEIDKKTSIRLNDTNKLNILPMYISCHLYFGTSIVLY